MALNLLTERAIRAATLPAGAAIRKLNDGAGLHLALLPSGSRVWRLAYTFAGKRNTASLGAYPDVSIDEARATAAAMREKIRAGVDPVAARRTEATRTFGAFATRLRDIAEKSGRRKATLSILDRHLAGAIAAFGNRDVGTITPKDVVAVLAEIEKRGALSLIDPARSAILRTFDLAVGAGLLTTNPAVSIRRAHFVEKGARQNRPAITKPDQFGEMLRRLWLPQSGRDVTALFLRILVLVAVRPGELRAARWTEFDLAGGVWSIPADRMKTGKPHKVALAPQVVDLLTELRQIVPPRCEFLFPCRDPGAKGATGYIGENVPPAALRRLGYTSKQISAHGLRASFSTLANSARIEVPGMTGAVPRWAPEVIEAALAHTDKDRIRSAYNREVPWAERMALSDWWADECDRLRAEAEVKTAAACRALAR